MKKSECPQCKESNSNDVKYIPMDTADQNYILRTVLGIVEPTDNDRVLVSAIEQEVVRRLTR